ncbi:MAG: SGNH/GDSL hydrolase family protein [Nitrospinae bacterium]|nr:SGNH/GDSL hydrolase family protein [Nitrospinota bacterium]
MSSKNNMQDSFIRSLSQRFPFTINILLLIFSIVFTLSLIEIALLFREKSIAKHDIQWTKDSNVNQLIGRNPVDILKVQFFNGCFIDKGIMTGDPILGYVNIPNVEGYSIRVYNRPNLVVKKPFDFSIFAHNNLQTEIAPFSINNLGNRGTEMTVEKPIGVSRIVFLGDSITFGYYVEEEQTFAVQIGNMISSVVSPKCRIEVLNAGVSSLNAHQIFGHLRHRALSWSPDLIFWAFYVNDICDREGDVLFPVRNLRWLSPLHLSALGRFIEESVFSTSLGSHIGIDTENSVNRFIEESWKRVEMDIVQTKALLQEHNIPFVIIAFPSAIQFSRHWTNQYYQIRLKKLCEKYNVPYVDVLPALEKAGSAEDIYYRGDLVHPNARGHKATADAIFSLIKENTALLKRLSNNCIQ